MDPKDEISIQETNLRAQFYNRLKGIEKDLHHRFLLIKRAEELAEEIVRLLPDYPTLNTANVAVSASGELLFTVFGGASDADLWITDDSGNLEVYTDDFEGVFQIGELSEIIQRLNDGAENEPVAYCPKCGRLWYVLEGFCGGCEDV